jgi:type IV pilus assembly protein PilA
MKKSSGFTLIELLIVIAIIGILATVAMPYYQGYMLRARLVEVENGMATVRSAVSVYYQDNQLTWPNCPNIDAVRTSLGVALGAVNRIQDISVAVADGSITAIVDNVHSMVDGKTIILKPLAGGDGSLKWAWDYGPGFPMQLKQRGK